MHPKNKPRLSLDIRVHSSDVLLEAKEVYRKFDVLLEIVLCVEGVLALVL